MIVRHRCSLRPWSPFIWPAASGELAKSCWTIPLLLGLCVICANGISATIPNHSTRRAEDNVNGLAAAERRWPTQVLANTSLTCTYATIFAVPTAIEILEEQAFCLFIFRDTASASPGTSRLNDGVGNIVSTIRVYGLLYSNHDTLWTVGHAFDAIILKQ